MVYPGNWFRTTKLRSPRINKAVVSNVTLCSCAVFQVSDIHISIFADDERIKQFREFASETVDVVQPSVVLATGDLTDAKDDDHLGSRQYLKEWMIYHEVIETTGVRNKTLWLDIRGNHGI